MRYYHKLKKVASFFSHTLFALKPTSEIATKVVTQCFGRLFSLMLIFGRSSRKYCSPEAVAHSTRYAHSCEPPTMTASAQVANTDLTRLSHASHGRRPTIIAGFDIGKYGAFRTHKFLCTSCGGSGKQRPSSWRSYSSSAGEMIQK